MVDVGTVRFICKSFRMLLKIQFIQLSNFYFVFLAVCFTYLGSYTFIYFLMKKFNTVLDWNLYHVTFVFAVYQISFGITNLIMSQFKYFSDYVHRGTLDILMIRPMSLFLQIIMRGCEFVSLGNIAVGVFLVVMVTKPLEIEWSAIQIFKFMLLIVNSSLFIGGIYLIGATMSIYIINGKEVRDLLVQTLQNYLIYPKEAYERWIQAVLVFSLLYFVTNKPAQWFLGIADSWNAWSVILGLPFFLGIYGIWNFCLKSYTGAGN